jgi:hypothetical protein
LQLRVLHLGLLHDGDVGVGVLPEREKVLVCLPRAFFVAAYGLRPAQLQVRERAQHEVQNNAPVINQLLKLGCCLLPLPLLQIGFTAHIRGIKAYSDWAATQGVPNS